jgi:anti-sigma B factor antagonist
MPLQIIHRKMEGIEILDLKGCLSFGQEDSDFRNELERLLQSGKTRVALNLDDLRELDPTGLATLLFAREQLRKAGGNLAIFNLHQSHIELLVDAQLEAALVAFQTEGDAIDSFFPDRAVKAYDVLEFVETAAAQYMKSEKPLAPLLEGRHSASNKVSRR